MTTPEELKDMIPKLEVPYIESIKEKAKYLGLKIGKIRRKDYGLCSKTVSNELETDSYVTRFWADVIGEAT
jgi:hypothetical protein